ncbi:hypothetical protein DSM112329_04313 [Paraconexibacter sp. AEG42_29]|uniref:Uncharacterized protein n=1 Tax=Paraconexibacter sp. AEG42_29 TaxID=2997339 RepID=A0AAU7B0M4_9ACTN
MSSQTHNLVHYDATQRRLWIAGQRCHHGATGALMAGIAAAGLAAARLHMSGTVALLAAGTLLMADDWHDRRIWFERGWQNQPWPDAHA